MEEKDKLLNAIFKIVQILNKSYLQILEQKKKFLNHPIMLGYFFYRPIIRTSNLQRAINLLKDVPPKRVVLGPDRPIIETLFLELYQALGEYQIDYRRYLTIVSKYHQLTGTKPNLDKKLNFVPKITKGTDIVGKMLEKISADYVPNWSFKLLDEKLIVHEKRPYSFQTDLKVDFLGYVIGPKDRLVMYAIIFDEDKLTIGDYLKQYFLQKMNIHLLRLNKKLKIGSEIKLFLNEIKNSQKYIIKNGLDIENFKYSTKILLLQFYSDYQYNHINCLRYCECEPDEIKENYCKNPMDTAYIISDDVAKIFTTEKYIFTK